MVALGPAYHTPRPAHDGLHKTAKYRAAANNLASPLITPLLCMHPRRPTGLGRAGQGRAGQGRMGQGTSQGVVWSVLAGRTNVSGRRAALPGVLLPSRNCAAATMYRPRHTDDKDNNDDDDG